jgi:hypothetical protein
MRARASGGRRFHTSAGSGGPGLIQLT